MPANNEADNLRLLEVNRIIHEPARYNILTLLYVVERAEFLFVQNQTGLTPGNLSTHVSKLETAGYVSVEKEFVGKLPRTFLSLTGMGREAYENYRATMKDLFNTPPGAQRDSRNE